MTLSNKITTLVFAALFSLMLTTLAFAATESAGGSNLLTPPLVDDSPVSVTVGIYVVNIAAVDEVKETFELDGYLKESWQDDRVKYLPQSGSLLRSRNYSEDELWHPRLIMLNAAEPRTKDEATIRAQPDGKVIYVERFVATLSVSYDVRRFPFDSQSLVVDLQPTIADRELVALTSGPNLLQLNRAKYAGMAQWHILGLSEATTVEMVDGTTDKISQVEMTIHVKRRYGFYIWKVFIPLLLMVAVSWTIFWMSLDDFSNQILVAITTILTVIAFAFSIESNLPKVPYVTYIDAFFLCCYFFVFVTVLELMAVHIVLRRRGHDAALRIRHFAQWSVPTVFIALNAVLIPHFFLQ